MVAEFESGGMVGLALITNVVCSSIEVEIIGVYP
jgi:hypothetical protein